MSVDITGKSLSLGSAAVEALKSPYVWGIGTGILLSWLYISGLGKRGILSLAGLTQAEAERVISKIEQKTEAIRI